MEPPLFILFYDFILFFIGYNIVLKILQIIKYGYSLLEKKQFKYFQIKNINIKVISRKKTSTCLATFFQNKNNNFAIK